MANLTLWPGAIPDQIGHDIIIREGKESRVLGRESRVGLRLLLGCIVGCIVGCCLVAMFFVLL